MNEPKRILILYADAGFGHRMAANAIQAALQEKYGADVEVLMINPLDDPRAPSVLRDSQTDYDRMVRRLPELYKLGYQASDAMIPSTLVESALIVLLFEVINDVVRDMQPDVIITTYPLYQAPLDAVFTLSRKRAVPVFTVVTDLSTVHRLWFNTTVSRCLVPTDKVRILALEASLPPERVTITGIPVHPNLVRETRPAPDVRAEMGWRPDLTTILAVGSRRVENLPEFLRVVNHSGLPVQVAAVAGGDEGLYQELRETEWHIPAHLYNFVDNMPQLMHASDLVAAKAGGLIVTEALACGLPMLLIQAIPGQETGNASYVVDSGAGELALDPVAALETLFHWLDQDGRQLTEHANYARQQGRPFAAYEIAKLAWEAAQHNTVEKNHRRGHTRTRLVEMLKRNQIPVNEKS